MLGNYADFTYLCEQNNKSMWYKIVKWVAWAITMVMLLYVGTAVIWLINVCTTSVYNTPWGKVDADTAKIGFLEFWSHEPCYEIHKEIIGMDTVRYYFFKSREIYYKAEHDSTGDIQIRLYYPYNDRKDGEICTKHFRKEDIFIR